jgi:hypothetical protein
MNMTLMSLWNGGMMKGELKLPAAVASGGQKYTAAARPGTRRDRDQKAFYLGEFACKTDEKFSEKLDFLGNQILRFFRYNLLSSRPLQPNHHCRVLRFFEKFSGGVYMGVPPS